MQIKTIENQSLNVAQKLKLGFTNKVFKSSRALKLVLILAVFVLALILRLRAVQYLDTDDDEPTYLRAAQLYAQDLAAGYWPGIIKERANFEHPPMAKLIFGEIFYLKNDYTRPVLRRGASERGQTQRVFDAVIGALTAGIVAIANPLAGLLVAVNAWHIKYTSEAMLEALPCLFSAICLLALLHTKRNGDKWWWLGAIMLGLSASSKYIYAVAGVGIVLWFILRDRRSWKWTILWLGVSLLTFFITDPALWSNPLVNLWNSLVFNTNYQSGAEVTQFGYQWWQPLVWLFLAEPVIPRNHIYTFPLMLDNFIAITGFLGLVLIFLKQRHQLLAFWMVTDLFFLLLWPTKWSQYIIILTVPLAISTAELTTDIWTWLTKSTTLLKIRKVFWVVYGV